MDNLSKWKEIALLASLPMNNLNKWEVVAEFASLRGNKVTAQILGITAERVRQIRRKVARESAAKLRHSVSITEWFQRHPNLRPLI